MIRVWRLARLRPMPVPKASCALVIPPCPAFMVAKDISTNSPEDEPAVRVTRLKGTRSTASDFNAGGASTNTLV
jgi:hypothetical protein